MPHRLINRVVQFRHGEAGTAWLMFAYSFLAMTAHNILKPITRSKFITQLRRRQPAVHRSWARA